MHDLKRNPGETMPVRDDFPAIVQTRYGEPSDVLALATLPGSTLRMGSGDVVIAVRKRLIHPGDIHMIRGVANGGTASPVEAGKARVPGFEGVGVIEFIGEEARQAGELAVGQRVAFFAGSARSWAAKVVVPASAAIVLPASLSDAIAAQVLINTITARILLRAGHNALPPGFERPVFILQTAAGSAVGRLVSRLAMDLDVVPIRLVRSAARARSLSTTLPGVVISTDSAGWTNEVREQLGGSPLHVAIDAVGGRFLDDVASLLADGGTVVNFGWLGSGAPDLASFAPRDLTLKGISIGSWGRSSAADRAADRRVAIGLGQEHPELFEVAGDFPLEAFEEAIRQAGSADRSAAILLSS
jgi:NADPH2:quinone reductase